MTYPGPRPISGKGFRETVLPLVDYYVQTRYPDIGEFIDYTKTKAEDALERAQQTVNVVKEKLGEA